MILLGRATQNLCKKGRDKRAREVRRGNDAQKNPITATLYINKMTVSASATCVSASKETNEEEAASLLSSPIILLRNPLKGNSAAGGCKESNYEATTSLIGPYDIICGRCSTAFNNIGNRRFRVLISLNLKSYTNAKSKRDKGQVIYNVVRVFLDDIGARFLKRGGKNVFVELGEKEAREKVGHALRDMAVQQEQSQKALLQQQQQQDESKQQMEDFGNQPSRGQLNGRDQEGKEDDDGQTSSSSSSSSISSSPRSSASSAVKETRHKKRKNVTWSEAQCPAKKSFPALPRQAVRVHESAVASQTLLVDSISSMESSRRFDLGVQLPVESLSTCAQNLQEGRGGFVACGDDYSGKATAWHNRMNFTLAELEATAGILSFAMAAR